MPAFILGTRTFFKQSSAPTGWTKSTANDDYTIRVVNNSSTGGTLSGSLGFTTCFTQKTINPTLTGALATVSSEVADTPAHTHTVNYTYTPSASSTYQIYNSGSTPFASSGGSFIATGGVNQGGDGIHSHSATVTANHTGGTIDFRVKYVDFILASKN